MPNVVTAYVDHAGDEGGIVCKVELGPEVGDGALFASIGGSAMSGLRTSIFPY